MYDITLLAIIIFLCYIRSSSTSSSEGVAGVAERSVATLL